MKKENYSSKIIKKPWGFEYLIYENENVALWALHIKYKHSTSYHCHSEKTTGLIVLDGKCKVSFLDDSKTLSPLDKIMIRKRLFHSTKSLSQNGSIIFELETPNNKSDLIRLKDNYGRQGLPYEDHNHELEKPSDYLWIDEKIQDYSFYNYQLQFFNIANLDFLKKTNDNSKIIFLDGGLLSNNNQYVVAFGDILDCKTILELSPVIKKVQENTKILIIKQNESD